MTFQDPAPSGRDQPGQRPQPGPAGHTYRVVADRASTGGGYSLTEASSAPGAGVPLHTHDDAVECFYVIAGEYRLTVGAAVHDLRSGDLLLIPRGAPHQFDVTGPEQGRALEVFAPAGCGPLPELSGRPAPHWRRPRIVPPGSTVSGRPPRGPEAVFFAGAGRAGQPGAGSPGPAEDTRTRLVVSLRSDQVSGASWRVDPGTTAVWVLAGRYRMETATGPVTLGEGEILPAERAGNAIAVAGAPSSRALVLRL